MNTTGIAIIGVIFILINAGYAYLVYIGKYKVAEEKKSGIYKTTLVSIIIIALMILNLIFRFI